MTDTRPPTPELAAAVAEVRLDSPLRGFADPGLEAQFRLFDDEEGRIFARLGLGLSIVAWIFALGVLRVTHPAAVAPMARVVAFVLIPFFAFALVATYRDSFAGWYQPLAAVANALAGLAITYCGHLVGPPYGAHMAMAGEFVVIFFAFYVFRLRLVQALAATGTYVLVFQVWVLVGGAVEGGQLFFVSYVLWLVEVCGAFIGWMAELTNRRLFVQQRTIERQHERIETQRDLLRRAFGQYVSERVAETLLASDTALEVGGESREVTILFSDLAGYSTISERLDPQHVIAMLNEYMGAMTEVVEEAEGCVIEFLGDGVLAVFGAPVPVERPAERALRCARAMRARLAELNARWAEGAPWDREVVGTLRMRVGIHSGRVVVGNLGSERRKKYAVIGDAVNVAARLEQLNKETGTEILLSAAVLAGLDGDAAERLVDQGEHVLKGRAERVRVYAA